MYNAAAGAIAAVVRPVFAVAPRRPSRLHRELKSVLVLHVLVNLQARRQVQPVSHARLQTSADVPRGAHDGANRLAALELRREPAHRRRPAR